ncbi:Activating transcription factor 7-interacting protein 1 [Dryobates pubescens]|uniref:Activating transcription factor 7-interacting protein 1 n=1 Tax=Dryobates pubescens TaxID=118200 RepID=A0A093IQ73_DRYPU|nr:Activating transcription factor 7-interacting protein 1 [Dryobates pubescens]
MDSTDEPQKKVFKARKTMRASDRQQLEVVYKVKEELLKTTEVKLLNGKHENGDSDLNSPLSSTDCTEDKREVNGVVDLRVNSEEEKPVSDEISEAKSPENRAGNTVSDIESKPLTLSPENVTPKQDKDTETDKSTLACEIKNEVCDSNKDNFHEENNTKDHLDQRESDVPSEGESKSICNTSDPSEEKEETNDSIINSSTSDEEKRAERVTAEGDVGEEAISSSVEADQEPKDDKQDSTADLLDSTVQKTEKPNESILDTTDSMETDEIIPILEKLAPAEDELSCFSKGPLLPVDDTVPDLEEKMDSCLSSPSKQESNENLPKEAFLVLSDEEEPCDEKEECAEVMPPNEPSLPEEVKEWKKESEKVKGEPQEQEEKYTEKSEVSRRKRSKSEDMDNVHSKRRRYIEEDYEAELQVKITARKDVDQKIEKIIQRLLEEKLAALQCAVFDKTLEDLKTRIEKVECNKRHKTVLTELKAKIARLTKRFGAAREDLKKRQENAQSAPLSPGKAASDTVNTTNTTYRSAGTVRQILESKRNVGESTPATFQAPVNTAPSLAASSAVVSAQPKPQTPMTSTSSLTTAVLPTANTAAVVGASQVPSGSAQSVSVSLQSLPVILHVPVAVSSQPQLLQGHPGTLVPNQQAGSVEFISVQSSSTIGSLSKTTVSLASTKPNNSTCVPSPGTQRNSPAASIGTTLAVQAVSTAHPVVQTTRTSLPTVGTSGLYNATSNRAPLQMKIPLSAFSNPAPVEPPVSTALRIENQTSKPPTDTSSASANKRTAEGATQSGKVTGTDSGGVIDLTLDEEDENSLQDTKKQNQTQTAVTGLSVSTQPLARPAQPSQPAPVQQTGVPTSGPSQATLHVLPAASTTVNVTHRPVTQTAAKLPIPRAPTNHQVVYTTLPAPPAQNPVRGALMPSPGLRPVNPQAGGMTVRMPQTAAYVVNNGLTLGSGAPQLTVHHRPPQVHAEPPRPVHPAPLPEAPQPSRLPPEAANTSLPQKPQLKLARVQSQNGIVLSWSVMEVDRSCATVDSYHLYAYHEDPSATMPSQWKKIGEVKALPLPMACTLTQFVSGSKYYFAVRAKDIYGRFGPFCDPQSTDVISSQSS